MTVQSWERTSEFLEGSRRRRRDIVTPEGVSLPFELADYGERAVAFVLDVLFQNIITIVLLLVAVFAFFGGRKTLGDIAGPVMIAITLFTAFLIRNFYFIHFELSWQGATPGKRIAGIRVADRHGGPLRPAAIVARNLTREIEMFMPLGLMSSLGQGSGAWQKLSLGLWLMLFLLLPLFNRDRMRAGDLIAGTMVIAVPKRMLLADLVEHAARFVFTDRQLGAYGAFELQVLEELLRRTNAPDAARLRGEVCDKIRRKIEWPEPVASADCAFFLRDFYTAERDFLERAQLYGKHRADKHAAAEKAVPF